jgi:predicted AlkP superfamily phosphohydrolase/phosphomutase
MYDPRVLPTRRVLALGLSEAAPDYLQDPALAAQVPFLTRIAGEGATGTTLAPQPLLPEEMWETIVTGRSVSALREIRPVLRKRGALRHERSIDDLSVSPIWRILEDRGRATAIFNLRLTFRTEPLTGFMIARGTHRVIRRDLVHPSALYERLQRQFGEWVLSTRASDERDWTSTVISEIETRTDVLIELLTTRRWDFALAQLPEISRTQHRFWTNPVIMPEVYGAADRALSRLADAVGPETIIFVFSECGAGPVRHAVSLNAWLEREGFLVRRRVPIHFVASRIGRTYLNAKKVAPRIANWFPALKSRTRSAFETLSIDWSRTRAYSPRDGGSIVLTGDDPRLADELREKLLTLRDPEGRPVIEGVIGPDLTIVWDEDAYTPAADVAAGEEIFVRPQHCGTHRREGILLVFGGGIGPVKLGRIPLTSLVPTWLDLLDVPRTEHERASFASAMNLVTAS